MNSASRKEWKKNRRNLKEYTSLSKEEKPAQKKNFFSAKDCTVKRQKQGRRNGIDIFHGH